MLRFDNFNSLRKKSRSRTDPRHISHDRYDLPAIIALSYLKKHPRMTDNITEYHETTTIQTFCKNFPSDIRKP